MMMIDSRRLPWWMIVLPVNIILLSALFWLTPRAPVVCPPVHLTGNRIEATRTITRYLGPTIVAPNLVATATSTAALQPAASASPTAQSNSGSPPRNGPSHTHVRPPIRIVAMVFAGRRRFLSVLECYLRRNLMSNGGWLDEVVWMINTGDKEDVDFIMRTVEKTDGYIAQHVGDGDHEWANTYKNVRDDTLYVKIDDDVVFFDDNTIPAIVSRLWENRDHMTLVSANVVNHPAFAFVHYHLDAMKPYVPELQKPAGYDPDKPPSDWRPSKIPLWKGNAKKDIKANIAEKTPYKNHRWLRLPRDEDIPYTPAGVLAKKDGDEYNAFNAAMKRWGIAAQEHYSFLENMERGELWRYGGFDLWNMHYQRLSINLIAILGTTLLKDPPPDREDEVFLTMTLPAKLEKPAVIDGRSLAVHMNFGLQTDPLGETDLLARYALFAEENVCGGRWGDMSNKTYSLP